MKGMRTENELTIPSGEREQEIAWIHANLEAFWSFAQEEFQVSGRGALVVDTREVVEFEGALTHPLMYVPQADAPTIPWVQPAEISRLVGVYDPVWEFVTVLVKAESESVYRMGVTINPET